MSAAKAGENHPLFGRLGPLSHMFGKILTAETRQRISDALKGRVISEETRKRLSEAQKRVDRSGEKHPIFGKIPTSAHPVYVYSLDNELIKQFPSKKAAADWLKVSGFTVNYYIKTKKVFQGKYLLSSQPL